MCTQLVSGPSRIQTQVSVIARPVGSRWLLGDGFAMGPGAALPPTASPPGPLAGRVPPPCSSCTVLLTSGTPQIMSTLLRLQF